jgi:PKD repeat protein
LDAVRLYTLAELSPIVPACAGANVSVLFTAPNHICPGTCTSFNNLSVNATSYQWFFPGATPSSSTDVSPTNICYNNPGSYSVTLMGTNGITSDTITLNNYITVYPYPAQQGILQNGDTLFANAGAVSYQWYHAGNLIPGATNYFYVATEGGDYNIVATDANGCEVEAAIFDVVAEVQSVIGSGSMQLFPNPVTSYLNFNSPDLNGQDAISIYNMLGEKVFTAVDYRLGTIDCRLLPSGLYWLEISTGDNILRSKFIKACSR